MVFGTEATRLPLCVSILKEGLRLKTTTKISLSFIGITVIVSSIYLLKKFFRYNRSTIFDDRENESTISFEGLLEELKKEGKI